MSGLKTVIPAALTDTSLPVIRDDSLLTNGSLLLVDMAHSTRPALPSGVPASGAQLANIADSLAATLLGVAANTLAAPFTYDAVMNDGASGKIERTGKGGLHVMVKQASAMTSTKSAAIEIPPNIRTYIYANNAHSYYVSLWGQVTRGSGLANNATPYGEFAGAVSNSLSKLLFYIGDQGSGTGQGFSAGGGLSVQHDGRPAAGGAGNLYVALAGSASASLSDTDLNAPYLRNVGAWGSAGLNSNAALLQKEPSWIFHRAYIEDLTVSGRTAAAVYALEQARQAADYAAGGKFNGETFSDPATVVP